MHCTSLRNFITQAKVELLIRSKNYFSVLTLPAVYGFAVDDYSNIPVKYRIPKLQEIMSIFDTHVITSVIAEAFLILLDFIKHWCCFSR